MSRAKDCAKSWEIWGLLTWALLVGLLDVSSFSCAGDVQADPESLISPSFPKSHKEVITGNAQLLPKKDRYQ